MLGELRIIITSIKIFCEFKYLNVVKDNISSHTQHFSNGRYLWKHKIFSMMFVIFSLEKIDFSSKCFV